MSCSLHCGVVSPVFLLFFLSFFPVLALVAHCEYIITQLDLSPSCACACVCVCVCMYGVVWCGGVWCVVCVRVCVFFFLLDDTHQWSAFLQATSERVLLAVLQPWFAMWERCHGLHEPRVLAETLKVSLRPRHFPSASNGAGLHSQGELRNAPCRFPSLLTVLSLKVGLWNPPCRFSSPANLLIFLKGFVFKKVRGSSHSLCTFRFAAADTLHSTSLVLAFPEQFALLALVRSLEEGCTNPIFSILTFLLRSLEEGYTNPRFSTLTFLLRSLDEGTPTLDSPP
jgi:hypothetical protein